MYGLTGKRTQADVIRDFEYECYASSDWIKSEICDSLFCVVFSSAHSYYEKSSLIWLTSVLRSLKEINSQTD